MTTPSSSSSGSTLRDRRALVTGAASGIGLAIVEALVAEGATVLASDIAGPALDAVKARLGVAIHAADLTQRADVERLAEAAGACDVLINNAGLQHVSPIEEFDPAMWDRLLAVMLTAPFLLIRALLPRMYAKGWGRIINVASVHALVASPYKSAYVTAKHGVLGLTKTVALEAGARCPQITVNAVCPSYVRTPLVEKQIAQQARAHGISDAEVLDKVLLTQNAIKRLIEPAEVAHAVLHLLDERSWSITGGAVTMDAGWLAH